ncbi:glucose-6-phosphate isomerase [Sphingomonas baiyangensis]|uniref:Glucose-6-phosphate isomerase n=1 Tax=Sphingomonas baiyangensis TaxID=2572576 RepID=A0A4U1L7D5_9SPHN|nr:glucose-6-phosphate isomerase [Sphingomonas baiyangensis]TKD52862.1 glucose-6-phosphate isomerase [Sphingomonas baiyangensis]
MPVPDWSPIESAPRPTLTELFAADDNRLAALAHDVAGIQFDFAKTHLTPDLVSAFATLAEQAGFADKRAALFGGEAVNVTEGRAAEHTAERGEGAAASVDRARAQHQRMRAVIDAIEAEAFGPIRHVLHIGIGGSALGPELLVSALGHEGMRYDVAIVSNVDGVALETALDQFDPEATLIAVASKTFTTTETMLNAESALGWLAEAGVDDPYGRVIALTANPEKAVEWGVDETRILPFSDSVGGRYSLWSSIGFPAAMALGWDAFEELLEGAAAMDRHFRLTEPTGNVAMLAAFADLYYTQVRGAETRGVFAYDERLALLPSYLQQLEMESNGKSVTAEGAPLGRPSAAITWGGVGTDAQHAVFQLLHQGTHLVPVEFVAVREGGDALSEAHHRQLLLNAFAQGAALMAGKPHEDGARAYPGNRPSTTLLLDTLDARTLGALIAFYEHRTFTNAALLGINPFDQFGVELGKEMAKAADAGDLDFDASTNELIRLALG